MSWTKAKVVRWVDGDTVVTSLGTVRLIGIDTPERGVCGYSAATKLAAASAPAGSTIRLGNPSTVVNTDRYGRLLRYVDRVTATGAIIDIGLRQIVKGSRARYDSLDGHQWHARQSKYRTADRAYRNYSCTTTTTTTDSSSSTSIPAGWYTDATYPGYTGCRQGYPGGYINGVYVWKPIAC